MAEGESKYKFIADEVLERLGKTKADVIRNLPEGIPPRSVYAYFKRGQGAIEIAAAIAEASGCTLNDIYVPIETGSWESATAVSSDSGEGEAKAEKADANADGIMAALMAWDDPELLMHAAFVLGSIGKMPEAGMLNDRANQLKDGDSSAE